MGKLRRPEVAPGALADLVRELHALHARAGRPSMRDLAKGQDFSHTTVHNLFTRTTAEPPRPPVLLAVVERLATIAPRTNVDETLDRFDALWREADAEPFEAPVEESAMKVAATGREPVPLKADEQAVLEQTAHHQAPENIRLEREETPLEDDRTVPASVSDKHEISGESCSQKDVPGTPPSAYDRCSLVAADTSPVFVNLDDTKPLKHKYFNDRVRLVDRREIVGRVAFQAVRLPVAEESPTGYGWMRADDLIDTPCQGAVRSLRRPT